MLKKKVSDGSNVHVISMSIGECEMIADVIRNQQSIDSVDNDTFQLLQSAFLTADSSGEIKLVDYLKGNVDTCLMKRAQRKYSLFCKDYNLQSFII